MNLPKASPKSTIERHIQQWRDAAESSPTKDTLAAFYVLIHPNSDLTVEEREAVSRVSLRYSDRKIRERERVRARAALVHARRRVRARSSAL